MRAASSGGLELSEGDPGKDGKISIQYSQSQSGAGISQNLQEPPQACEGVLTEV